MVQAAALALAGCTAQGPRTFLLTRATSANVAYTMCTSRTESQAVTWEHTPATGFYKNGVASVAKVTGLADVARQEVVVQVTATHADGSVHRVPHVSHFPTGHNGLEVEYTITDSAAVRVRVQLQAREAQLSRDFEPAQMLTHVWLEDTLLDEEFMRSEREHFADRFWRSLMQRLRP
jgi:hypothetical protein